MRSARFNRRQFLQTTSRTVAATSLTALVRPASADDVSATLDAHTIAVLARVCRTLFPHDGLDDSYYATCVDGLDDKAAADAALVKTLVDGVVQLDGSPRGKFLDMNETDQTAILAEIEGGPFFSVVHGHMVTALYNNPRAWPHFGYEGPSYPFGGYLDRGFDDIDWLSSSQDGT